MATLEGELSEAWDRFTDAVRGVSNSIEVAVAGGQSAHNLLRSVVDVAYYKAKALYPSDGSARTNPGSLSGLFFEQFTSAAVSGYLRRSGLGDRKVFRGKWPESRPAPDLPKNPDICLSKRGQLVVIECKTAPQGKDLSAVLKVRERHLAAGIPYFLVAGEASRRHDLVDRIIDEGWGAFLAIKRRGRAFPANDGSVDRLFGAIVAELDRDM